MNFIRLRTIGMYLMQRQKRKANEHQFLYDLDGIIS
jgi:hypothetical protein